MTRALYRGQMQLEDLADSREAVVDGGVEGFEGPWFALAVDLRQQGNRGGIRHAGKWQARCAHAGAR